MVPMVYVNSSKFQAIVKASAAPKWADSIRTESLHIVCDPRVPTGFLLHDNKLVPTLAFLRDHTLDAESDRLLMVMP